MKFVNRFSSRTDLESVITELVAGLNGPFDLGIIFISGFKAAELDKICRRVRETLQIKTLLGCSGYGVIGVQNEWEGMPAASLLLADVNDAVHVIPFVLDQDDFADIKSKEAWYELLDVYPNENPGFLLLCDPEDADISLFLEGMNNAYPNAVIAGGLANNTRLDDSNVLVLNDRRYQSGIVGVALTGGIRLEAVVSQGCRPIGEPFIVTKSVDNVIYEIAGRPFYDVVETVLKKSRLRDRKLAQDAIYVGVAVDEYKYRMAYGDFLIRLLIGVDETSGAGVVTDCVRPGQTIQFQVRDPLKAEEDLKAVLDRRRKNKDALPQGVLIFSCSERGEEMFGRRNHDLDIFKKYLGKIPLAGFFSAGEIGPLAGKNYMHGLSTCAVLFYPREGTK